MGLRLEEAMCSVNLEGNAHLRPIANQCDADNNLLDSQTSGIAPQPLISQTKGFFSVFLTRATANYSSNMLVPCPL